LEEAHNEIKDKSLVKFKDFPKMDDAQMSASCIKELNNEIDQLFIIFDRNNDSKSSSFLFTIVPPFLRTVLFIICVMVFLNFLIKILRLIGLEFFLNVAYSLDWICILLILFRVYTAYSGQYMNIAKRIDQQIDLLWKKVNLKLIILNEATIHSFIL
jgi:energy-coupling factor transporter transmembrane protein EcfT